MRKLFLTIAVAVSLAAMAPAQGQSTCGSRNDILKQLSKKYKEAPLAVGVTDTGKLIELLSSQGGETWTILLTMPNGRSCLVASGEGWRVLPFDFSNDPEA